MRAWKAMIAFLSLCLISNAQGQQERRSVLLPASELKAVSDRYSKDRLEKYDGSWNPTKADIDGLESSLSQISALKIHGWDSKIHIEHPERHFRQYVAVKVSGQNRIFVNAFCFDSPPSDWRRHLVVVYDGDICLWQALFDPSKRAFSNLWINLALEQSRRPRRRFVVSHPCGERKPQGWGTGPRWYGWLFYSPFPIPYSLRFRGLSFRSGPLSPYWAVTPQVDSRRASWAAGHASSRPALPLWIHRLKRGAGNHKALRAAVYGWALYGAGCRRGFGGAG